MDKSSNLIDVHVPGEKREYTRTLTGVELHGKETLEIVCTSEPDKADQMMSRLRMKGGGLYPSFIGVDVEFTSDEKPPQMAAVLQLCVEELCLVYHIAATVHSSVVLVLLTKNFIKLVSQLDELLYFVKCMHEYMFLNLHAFLKL